MLRSDCKKCRECCKILILETRYPAEEEALDFFRMRDCRVIAEHGFVTIEIDKPCPHLTEQGCKIYMNRPNVCKIYDCSKHQAPFFMRKEKKV